MTDQPRHSGFYRHFRAPNKSDWLSGRDPGGPARREQRKAIRPSSSRSRCSRPLGGLYRASEKKIVLFNKGITWLANQRKWNPWCLEKLVDIHEYAHAAHHLGMIGPPGVRNESQKAQNWTEKNISFGIAPNDLREQIAQLAPLLTIRACKSRS